MSALLTVPTLGKATQCTAYGSHRPTPLRFVWHHLLPESLGGATDTLNLVSVCDACHYSIHELLYLLRLSNGDAARWAKPGGGQYGSDGQRGYALKGWQLAVAAGVQNRIPNEGGVLA